LAWLSVAQHLLVIMVITVKVRKALAQNAGWSKSAAEQLKFAARSFQAVLIQAITNQQTVGN
jgi:ubiquinone/menaquinone biosynthesis C-methylase UbiE